MLTEPVRIEHVENFLTARDSLSDVRNQRFIFLFARREEGTDVAGSVYVTTAEIDGPIRHDARLGNRCRQPRLHERCAAPAAPREARLSYGAVPSSSRSLSRRRWLAAVRC